MIRERLVLLCLEFLVVEVTMDEIGHHLKRLKHDFDLKYILPCVENQQLALEAVLTKQAVKRRWWLCHLGESPGPTASILKSIETCLRTVSSISNFPEIAFSPDLYEL
jgi:hypothetical protein